MIVLFLLLLPAFLFPAVYTETDLSNPENLDKVVVRGATLTPIKDSVRYQLITPHDTLASGNWSTAVNGEQSAWPTLVSPVTGEFRFSFIYYRSNASGEGNYYMEKRLRLFPERDSLGFFCVPLNRQAHRDSLGTFLSRKIMLLPSAGVVGGFNAKSLLSPSGRVYRLCQGYGGNQDTVYVLDD